MLGGVEAVLGVTGLGWREGGKEGSKSAFNTSDRASESRQC